MLAPSFKKHTLHAKTSIHILVRLNGIGAHVHIDCGTTKNFINLAFMRRKGLHLVPLNKTMTCKFDEGTTEVTYGFSSNIKVGSKIVPVQFYAMSAKSNHGLSLEYYLLAMNDAIINFKTRELHLEGMSVNSLSSQMQELRAAREPVGDPKEIQKMEHKWGLVYLN